MGLSITKLFMIGLVPGLIIGLCLMVTWFFIVRIDGYKEKIEFKKGEASKIVRDAMPAFMMPVLLLGGHPVRRLHAHGRRRVRLRVCHCRVYPVLP